MRFPVPLNLIRIGVRTLSDMKSTCSAENCVRNIYRRGLCRTHYNKGPQYIIGLKPRRQQKLDFLANASTTTSQECILWPWAKYTRGYGKVFHNGGHIGTHQYVLQLAIGPPVDPDKWHVLHSCNNPLCCNWNHLRYGSHQDNLTQASREGFFPCGEQHHNSKLTSNQVTEIRKRFLDGERNASLSREFKVNHVTISNIITRKSWKHLG